MEVLRVLGFQSIFRFGIHFVAVAWLGRELSESSDVSPWPWPWSLVVLKDRSQVLGLGLGHFFQVLGLDLGLATRVLGPGLEP